MNTLFPENFAIQVFFSQNCTDVMVPAIYSQCFCGLFSLDKWSAVKKRPNMTCQKLPLAHKAKIPPKKERVPGDNPLF